MAGSPPLGPPGGPPNEPLETGAVGTGGDKVGKHIVNHLSPWKFPGMPDQAVGSDYPGHVELHAQAPATGEGIYDNMHPFKLQFFIDDDPESETFEQRRLRIYTGMLTTTLNTFTYSKDRDTDTTYECDVSIESTSVTTSAADTTGGSSGGTAGATYNQAELQACIDFAEQHEHESPDHTHEIECDLTSTSNVRDYFLTVGGQPAIPGMTQIEPEGFSDMTDSDDKATGFRARTLDVTYGKVWLTWKVDSNNIPDGMVPPTNVITDVDIKVEATCDDDKVGALTVTGGTANVSATREGADREGEYCLHIGTTFDRDDDDNEDHAKSIVQVIYENVYYSPFILPEYSY